MKKNFVILTELGRRNSGSGHYTRSLIIKKEIKRNCEIIIKNIKNIKINLDKKDIKINLINKNIEIKNFLKKKYKNILIIDKYKFDKNEINFFKKFFYKIFVFNDLKFIKNSSNFFSFYPQTLKKLKYTKNFIEGKEIFPVNEKLLTIRKKYKIRQSVKKIFLFFGGAVNEKVLYRIIYKINLNFSKTLKFYLYTNQKLIKKKIPKNFYIIKVNKNYFNDLLKYDLAIISSGFVKFDLLTIGMPIVYVPLYDHQIKIANDYSKNNFGVNLDNIKVLDYLTKSNKDTDYKNPFSYKKRLKIFKFYRSNFDGKGANIIKNYLLGS